VPVIVVVVVNVSVWISVPQLSPRPRLTASSLECSFVEHEARLIQVVNVVLVGFHTCWGCLFGCRLELDLEWSLLLDLEIALEYQSSMDIVIVMIASHLASRIPHLVFLRLVPRCFVSRPRRYLVAALLPFPFLFFRVSASAFVFDNVSYLGFYFSRWSNSKKGEVQGHNATWASPRQPRQSGQGSCPFI
jgi:hypothetical protein